MIRKLLVAAISVAALSMGAAAFASPAGAETFQTEKYPANIAGKATNAFEIGNGVRTLSCANMSMTGKLAAPSEELQLTSSIPKCTSEGVVVFPTIIEAPKLDVHFIRWTFFHIIPDYFIKLTPGKWKWDIFFTEEERIKEKPPLCTFEVSEEGNSAVETVSGTNEGSGAGRHMLMEFKSSNLLIKRTAGTEANCGKEKQSAGTIAGSFNFTASQEGKEQALFFE